METKETQWLRKHYQEAEVSGPATKHVKYEAIHSGISADFPDKTISTKVLSDALKSTFPKTLNKQYGYTIVRPTSSVWKHYHCKNSID